MKTIEGGVTAAKGFEAAATAAEIKYKGRTDMAGNIMFPEVCVRMVLLVSGEIINGVHSVPWG